MNIKYKVTLTEKERYALEKLTASGKSSARKIKRSQILLMSDHGRYTNQEDVVHC